MRTAILAILLLLLLAIPTSGQEGVSVNHQISLGDSYIVVHSKLTDANEEACLSVFPLVDGAEAEEICETFLLAIDALELEGNVSLGSFVKYNLRAVHSGITPDLHCAVSVPRTPGPKPLINCSL